MVYGLNSPDMDVGREERSREAETGTDSEEAGEKEGKECA